MHLCGKFPVLRSKISGVQINAWTSAHGQHVSRETVCFVILRALMFRVRGVEVNIDDWGSQNILISCGPVNKFFVLYRASFKEKKRNNEQEKAYAHLTSAFIVDRSTKVMLLSQP